MSFAEGAGDCELSGADQIAADMSENWNKLHPDDIIRTICKSYTQTPLKKIVSKLSFYKMITMIGKGTYGKVYKAIPRFTKRPVAIKCIDKLALKNSAMFEKVFMEVNILAQLHNPHVIKLYDIFENSKYYFLAMEFVENGDLMSVLKRQATFTEKQIFLILKDMLVAIEYLHSRNVFHRDIKLDNILLGADFHAKLCDFGISI